jgi:SAM-dependent methyltransferase
MYTKIKACRICGNTHLECVLDLGEQMLTGVFPRDKSETITTGPLRLVKCVGDDTVCGLLQMEHSYDLAEMYGDNYGYRSGLNKSMVEHLTQKVKKIMREVKLNANDLIVDIGSNDGTTLRVYPAEGHALVGIDPTAAKFKEFYPGHVCLIPEFFSSQLIKERFVGKKAKVITSFSMFYDLEDPLEFMRQIYDVLADDGIWVFEQSYMPTMLQTNSYDTVCHEHLEFYALRQIKWMADKVGFKILDVEFNDINGGSFSITVTKGDGNKNPVAVVNEVLKREQDLGLNTLKPYAEFAKRTLLGKNRLLAFLENARAEGKIVAALGASTKGNVLLQYCGITDQLIQFVAEVNPEKFSCYTPGSWLPIVPEQQLLDSKPDFILVLPWHFRKFFISNKKFSGMNLLFPLPEIEVVKVP